MKLTFHSLKMPRAPGHRLVYLAEGLAVLENSDTLCKNPKHSSENTKGLLPSTQRTDSSPLTSPGCQGSTGVGGEGRFCSCSGLF